jgi:ribosomal protein L31
MLSTIHTTKSLLPALPKTPQGLATSSSTSSNIRAILRGCTRGVSSSPYGRTHVWKRRPKRLPNPIVPQFPQRVIRSDGSSFTHWTTSPRPLIRLTRDVTNHPMWNVSSLMGEGAAEESEVTGRLGRFNRKFVVEEVDWMSESS